MERAGGAAIYSGMTRTRPYLYYDLAISICPVCYRKAEGKILIEDGKVLLRRRCPNSVRRPRGTVRSGR